MDLSVIYMILQEYECDKLIDFLTNRNEIKECLWIELNGNSVFGLQDYSIILTLKTREIRDQIVHFHFEGVRIKALDKKFTKKNNKWWEIWK